MSAPHLASELHSRGKLEGPRAARAEHPASRLQRLAETRPYRVAKAGVVHIVHATNVRGVEEVEDFSDALNAPPLFKHRMRKLLNFRPYYLPPSN